MKYVIDEEELKEYAEYCGWSFESIVKVLNLKSKSPVEEIAEGEVLIDYESGTTDILQGNNLRPIENIFKKEHRNVPVKIYIEVIK